MSGEQAAEASVSQAAASPLIYRAMVAAMREIGAVSKDRKNDQQGYKFRGIDQIYNEVHDCLAKAGIFTIPRVLEREVSERSTKSGGVQMHVVCKIEYDFVAADGSKITAGPLYGEGLDTSDKGTNKCMAQADKYTLLQVFKIPTEDLLDGDKETIEAGERRDPPPRQPPPARQPQGRAWQRLDDRHPPRDEAPPPSDEHPPPPQRMDDEPSEPAQAKPPPPGAMTVLERVAPNTSQIPADVQHLSRRLASLNGKTFAAMSPGQLAMVQRELGILSDKSAHKGNKTALLTLGIIVDAESKKRGAAQPGAQP